MSDANSVIRLALASALVASLAAGVAAQDGRGAGAASSNPSQSFLKASEIRGNVSPDAEAFDFELAGFSYYVNADGHGRRTKRGVARRFNLQLDRRDGLENIYASVYGGDLILVCGITDGDSGAGFVARLEQTSMRVLWKRHVPAFNIGEPLREGHSLYLTGIGFVARLDLNSGRYVWKHDRLYDTREGKGGSFTSFEMPELRRDTVLFKDVPVYNPRKAIVVNKQTGKIMRIE